MSAWRFSVSWVDSVVRVKICGITNLEDALLAADAGADAIGLVFAKSPRRISRRAALKIAGAVGPWVALVGVFVNERRAVIERIARECRLTAVQLHGDESSAEARSIRGVRVIKAFRVGKDFDFAAVRRYPGAALFDTRADGVYGGTGRAFDWRLLKGKKLEKPVILSGGLNPRNVREAVKVVRPWGVDASSSLERSAGKKDARLVREFIRNAKKS